MDIIFKDINDEEVKLAKKVWEYHIKVDHPRATKKVVEDVLKAPSLICKSQHANMKNHKQYYQGPWKNKMEKDRYYRVVVKICNDGNWISTAHVRRTVSCGTILYREGES